MSSCSRGNYIAKLFSIFFLVFWNSINLAYVLQLGNKDLVSDHIFTSQRESHSVPDMGFLLAFNYFVPFGVIENIFTKINGWSLKKMVVLSVNFTILILWSPVSSILVYATLIMWMNLPSYPNLRKAERIKSTLRILQEDFYSVYLTHQLCYK